MEPVEVLRDLSEVCRAAIKAGDWKVDGACDPDSLLRRADAAIASLTAPQPPAEAHCTTCSCVPGMTPAVRFDATPAEKEGAVRDHLIRMGWTPPAEAQPVGKVSKDTGLTVTLERLPYYTGTRLAKGTELYAHPPPSAPVGVEGWRVDPVEGDPDMLAVETPDGRTWFAKRGDRVFELAEALTLAQQPAAVDAPNVWRAAFVAERAARYREGGMAIEQARIHAETDATLMEQAASQPPQPAAVDGADAKDAEIDALRAEVEAWRELSDHVRAGACNAIWPDRYTDARTRDVAAALKRAERLAEALRELKDLMLGQVKWEPCDCGCPQQRTPDGPHSVTWLRAVQQVEIAISKAEARNG